MTITTRSTRISILCLVVAACGFPPPPAVPGDVPSDADPPPGSCQGDGECSGTTPFCVDNTCAICRTSTTCPASAPVCDMASHDCRGCAKDDECDSGACDLAVGTCVGQAAILYASPAGTAADPCTKMSPCSLPRAGELVDASHAYIVLAPGQYNEGAIFENKTATIVGHGGTIAETGRQNSGIGIYDGSSIVMRDVNITDLFSEHPSDLDTIIYVTKSELRVDNMFANNKFLYAIATYDDPSTVILTRSRFTNTSVKVVGRLVANACTFLSDGPSITGSVEITNSIIAGGISIGGGDLMHRSEIAHNTFIGGNIYCGTIGGVFHHFESNIFYNHENIQASDTCTYDYNLVTPDSGVRGTGNTTGDPLFVDAANNDFHLRLHSPAIDAANPQTSSNARDFDGVVRPQGTRADIGAFEYVP